MIASVSSSVALKHNASIISYAPDMCGEHIAFFFSAGWKTRGGEMSDQLSARKNAVRASDGMSQSILGVEARTCTFPTTKKSNAARNKLAAAGVLDGTMCCS